MRCVVEATAAAHAPTTSECAVLEPAHGIKTPAHLTQALHKTSSQLDARDAAWKRTWRTGGMLQGQIASTLCVVLSQQALAHRHVGFSTAGLQLAKHSPSTCCNRTSISRTNRTSISRTLQCSAWCTMTCCREAAGPMQMLLQDMAWHTHHAHLKHTLVAQTAPKVPRHCAL